MSRARRSDAVSRVLVVPTARRVLRVESALGAVLVPMAVGLRRWLADGPSSTDRGREFAAAAMIGFVVLGVAAAVVVLRGHRARVVRWLPAGVLGAAVLFGGSVAAPWPLGVPGVAMAAALLGIAASVGIVAMRSVVPANARRTATTMCAACFLGPGGLGGVVLRGGLDRRFGPTTALALLTLAALAAALILRPLRRELGADTDALANLAAEEDHVASLRAGGTHLPLLACHQVDFAYGKLQVLFKVDFTVDEGEMVALLGTNGAGKSTLLRVISGLGIPAYGSVRYQGEAITHLDAERRVRIGIAQIPGGRGVFGPLTVVENLRVQAYSHGRDRRAVEAGLDEAFATFPKLAERRNQPASTLSGGEQQMLALSSALITKPRLLLIDELSLGLAPKVVGQLLDVVRRINDGGTGVVLVEQSVNIALSVVHHAYFMEKGEIRFDGPAAELLERPDLLRSVFLEGASQALATTAAPSGQPGQGEGQ